MSRMHVKVQQLNILRTFFSPLKEKSLVIRVEVLKVREMSSERCTTRKLKLEHSAGRVGC